MSFVETATLVFVVGLLTSFLQFILQLQSSKFRLSLNSTCWSREPFTFPRNSIILPIVDLFTMVWNFEELIVILVYLIFWILFIWFHKNSVRPFDFVLFDCLHCLGLLVLYYYLLLNCWFFFYFPNFSLNRWIMSKCKMLLLLLCLLLNIILFLLYFKVLFLC